MTSDGRHNARCRTQGVGDQATVLGLFQQLSSGADILPGGTTRLANVGAVFNCGGLAEVTATGPESMPAVAATSVCG